MSSPKDNITYFQSKEVCFENYEQTKNILVLILFSFAPDTAGKLNVPVHDRNTLGM